MLDLPAQRLYAAPDLEKENEENREIMITMRICGLANLHEQKAFRPKELVTVLSPDSMPDDLRPRWIKPACHHVFPFDDVEMASHPGAPTATQVAELIALGRRIAAPGAATRILIHCAAGVSRSTAAGFIFACIQRGPGDEVAALSQTVDSSVSDFVSPNTLMVHYADGLLDRGGAMVRVVGEWKETNFWT